MMNRFSSTYPLFFLLCLTAWACDGMEPEGPDTSAFEGEVQINPASFPAGGAVDLNLEDTGVVAQLDSVPSFLWDLKILAYRTSQGGRPAWFLFGDDTSPDAVMALDVSNFAGIGLGLAGFDSFTSVTADMQTSMSADGVFDFDPSADVDSEGNPDGTLLAQAYVGLVIGDKIVNLEADQQPVFLVRSREGLYYKFQQMARQGGGAVTLRWARFADDALE
ncbi:MAG TPA: hypothetical protein DCE41_11315 [Cytophagales bacterium]|nr:hypothetical protein [Cytophagales bacterium]